MAAAESHGHEPEGGDNDNHTLASLLGKRSNHDLFRKLLSRIVQEMREDVDKTFAPASTTVFAAADGAPSDKAPDNTRQSHENEASVESLSELHQDALKHFDNWSQSGPRRILDELKTETNEEHIQGENMELRDMDEPQRATVLHSCLLLLLGLEQYPAESRVMLLRLADALNLPHEILVRDEKQVAQGLLHAAKQQMNADEETGKRAHDASVSKKWKIGLGVAAGATLIGVTGGLAAPLLATGVGSVMGGIGLGSTAAATYLGAMAGSAPLVGALFGAYGGKMAGEIVDNYAKEISDFAFLPIRKNTFSGESSARRLRVAIGISGWLNESDEVLKPWRVVSGEGTEAFALRWEMEVLLNLGSALTSYVKSAAWGFAKSQIISHTIFAALSSALWPLGIAKVARVVDNPFSVALQRSSKAGKVLADALINKVQGERPVTLLGYSLGARVILSCLEELANRRAFGLVEKVVLAGAATSSDPKVFRKARSVVSGRFINAYSKKDYMLAFLFRTHNLKAGVAGLQCIEGVHGIDNVDVSSLVQSHFEYRYLTGQVMRLAQFEDLDAKRVQHEQEELEKAEAKVEKEQEHDKDASQGGKTNFDDDAESIERDIEKKKSDGASGWMNRGASAVKGGVSGLEAKFSKTSIGQQRGKDNSKGEETEKSDGEYNTDWSTQADEQKNASSAKSNKAIGSSLGAIVPGPSV